MACGIDVRSEERVHDAITRLSAQLDIAPKNALALEAGLLRHAAGSIVPHKVIQLEPPEAQPEQGPTAQQPDRSRRDAASTLRGHDPIADAGSMFFDQPEADRAEEPVAGLIGDRQAPSPASDHPRSESAIQPRACSGR